MTGAVVRTYFYTGEPECDRNMETFIKSIEGTAKVRLIRGELRVSTSHGLV